MLDDDNWIPAVDEFIQPIGLSPTRQWYLFRQIREYFREGTQDLTCPKPLTPLPGTGDDLSCLTEPPNQRKRIELQNLLQRGSGDVGSVVKQATPVEPAKRTKTSVHAQSSHSVKCLRSLLTYMCINLA